MSRHPLTTAFNVLLILYSPWSMCNGAIASVPCGFPGKPTNGSVTPEKNYYSEGETVEYKCTKGFSRFHLDSTVRSCKNGSWNGTMPYCNSNILKGKNAEIIPPSSSATKLGNLTDDDRSTCLELGPEHRMNQKRETSLNLEIFVSDSKTNKKRICGSIKRTVTGDYIRIYCTTVSDTKGFRGGVPGDSVIIEVNATSEFCDIQAYAYYGNTDCGLPEAPAFGSADYVSENTVKYNCQPGFVLVGPQHRKCDPNGDRTHWPKEDMPKCREIGSNCPSLTILNARISYYLNGSVAIIDCDVGIELAASKVLLCIKPDTWLGYAEHGTHCKRTGSSNVPIHLGNFWTVVSICSTAVAVCFVVVSMFLGWKLKSNGTQRKAVKTSSKTTSIQYEANKRNVSLDSASPSSRTKSRRSSPIYEEIGLQQCSGNQTKKTDRITSPQTNSSQKKPNRDDLGFALGASDFTYVNAAVTASLETECEYELMHGYQNLNPNIEPEYQNTSEPSTSANANV